MIKFHVNVKKVSIDFESHWKTSHKRNSCFQAISELSNADIERQDTKVARRNTTELVKRQQKQSLVHTKSTKLIKQMSEMKLYL